MVKAEKKAREKSWLNRLKTKTDLRFEIEDLREKKEGPDFLIRHQDRIVGIEVTELQLDRDRGQSEGSVLQEEFSLQQSVVSQAKKLYFTIKNQPINAQVSFRGGPGQSLQSVNRRDLAQVIAESLCQVSLGPYEKYRFDSHSKPPVPPPVKFIYACGLPDERAPRWGVITSGWSKEFQASDVESLLAKKNALISQYRKVVAENWLLIVADGGNPPGMFRAPEQNLAELPISEFDRTFLLCEPDRLFIEWPRRRI